MQRNYRTNIYGQLLTGTFTYNVKIAPTFETPDHDWKIASTPDELKEAIEDPAVANIKLDDNLDVNVPLTITSEKEIDLNSNTLTSTANISARDGGTLTLKNGKIVHTNGKSAICAYTNSAVELDGVEYEGTGSSSVFSADNQTNTKITVKNSKIKSGYYALTTNAKTPVGNTTITLENSTFIADETAMLINIPATVTVTDCKFQGGWQAVFLRGGTYSFKNCEINLVMDATYGDWPEKNNNADGTWKDGNQAVTAALLIGNKCTLGDTGYLYPTSVTLENTTFSVTGTNRNNQKAEDTPSVYIWSREEEGNGATFNYDDASYNSFKAAGSGLYVGNDGKNLTVNGQPYTAGSGE